MRNPLPQRATGRTYQIWTSTDRKEWLFSTATRSPIAAKKIVKSMRQNGKHVAMVSSDAKLRKVLKPLPQPKEAAKPKPARRPRKTVTSKRTAAWRETIAQASHPAPQQSAA